MQQIGYYRQNPKSKRALAEKLSVMMVVFPVKKYKGRRPYSSCHAYRPTVDSGY